MEIQKIQAPDLKERVETGPAQVNDDWPGFFIRGDNAFAIRLAIATILVNPNDVIAKAQLRALANELDSCNLNSRKENKSA